MAAHSAFGLTVTYRFRFVGIATPLWWDKNVTNFRALRYLDKYGVRGEWSGEVC